MSSNNSGSHSNIEDVEGSGLGIVKETKARSLYVQKVRM